MTVSQWKVWAPAPKREEVLRKRGYSDLEPAAAVDERLRRLA